MPTTPTPSVHDLRAQFEAVLASMTSEEAQRVSAEKHAGQRVRSPGTPARVSGHCAR